MTLGDVFRHHHCEIATRKVTRGLRQVYHRLDFKRETGKVLKVMVTLPGNARMLCQMVDSPDAGTNVLKQRAVSDRRQLLPKVTRSLRIVCKHRADGSCRPQKPSTNRQSVNGETGLPSSMVPADHCVEVDWESVSLPSMFDEATTAWVKAVPHCRCAAVLPTQSQCYCIHTTVITSNMAATCYLPLYHTYMLSAIISHLYLHFSFYPIQ